MPVDNFDTILLVEDNEDDLFLFERALRRINVTHRVQNVVNGREARCYLLGEGRYENRDEFPFPKFIIADNCTTDFNGLDFLRWLRAHPECRVIPVVMLSGSRKPDHVEEAYELGAHSYFEKPSDQESLQSLLKLIFDYWQQAVVPEPQEQCSSEG